MALLLPVPTLAGMVGARHDQDLPEIADPRPAMALRPVDGDIQIQQARLQVDAGDWHLQARFDVELPEAVRAGLDSGVPLNFSVELAVVQARRWWWPRPIVEHEQSYTVVYYELTRHYRLQAAGSQKSRNYRSLLAVLDALGNLDMRLPIDESAVSLASPGLQGRLRIHLDRSALPLPLQSMLSRAWRLASREYQWPLN